MSKRLKAKQLIKPTQQQLKMSIMLNSQNIVNPLTDNREQSKIQSSFVGEPALSVRTGRFIKRARFKIQQQKRGLCSCAVAEAAPQARRS